MSRFLTRTYKIDFSIHHLVGQKSSQWLALRETSIGSSEAAAVFPGKIATLFKPWQLKAKLRNKPYQKPFDEFTQRVMADGVHMEPRLRDELALYLDHPIVESGIFRDIDPLLGLTLSASCDGLVVDPKTGDVMAVAEFKWRAVSTADWKGVLGINVFCQIQHQMLVTNCPIGFVYVGGAENNGRSLWVVRQSPKYIGMWREWCQYSIIDDKRAPPGSEERVRRELDEVMRESVECLMFNDEQ